MCKLFNTDSDETTAAPHGGPALARARQRALQAGVGRAGGAPRPGLRRPRRGGAVLAPPEGRNTRSQPFREPTSTRIFS